MVSVAQSQTVEPHFKAFTASLEELSPQAISRYSELADSEIYTSVQLKSLNPIHKSVDESGRILLSDPDSGCMDFWLRAQHVEYLDGSNYEWSGFEAGSQDTTLCDCETKDYSEIRSETGMLASLRIDERHYHIEELQAGVVAVCKSDSLASIFGCGHDESQVGTGEQGVGFHDSNQLESRTGNFCPVDVLFVATSATASGRNLGLLGQQSVQSFNHIARNSQIWEQHVNMRYAGFSVISFTPTWNAAVDLATLSNPNGAVDIFRHTVGADIVVFLHDELYGTEHGRATILAGTATAYARVNLNEAVGAAPVFAHEMGHIFGGRHGVDEDPTPGSIHGKQIRKCLKRHNTTMMSGGASGVRIPYFTNPDINYRGKAIGSDDDENVSETIRGRGCIVAGFVNFPVQEFSAYLNAPMNACPESVIALDITVLNAPLGPITYEWFTSTNGINFTSMPGTAGFQQIILPSTPGARVWYRCKMTDSEDNTITDTREIVARCQGDWEDPFRTTSETYQATGGKVLLTVTQANSDEIIVNHSNLNSSTNVENKLILSDMQGKALVVVEANQSGFNTLSMASLAPGIYSVSFWNSSRGIEQTVRFPWIY